MRKIVLASASPRRSGILEKLGLDFDIMVPDLEENLEQNLNPESLARKLAYEKCAHIAGKLAGTVQSPLLVIAADTLVYKGHVMGKPDSPDDAFKMLKALQGSWHEVLTGICIMSVPEGKTLTDVESTRVKMRDLGDDTIRAYIGTGEPFGKAGAYAIQGYGSLLAEKIDGCYYNVVGLPVPMLFRMLEEYGIRLFSWLDHDGGGDNGS